MNLNIPEDDPEISIGKLYLEMLI